MISRELNPDWYRVRYNLATLHANWAADTEKGSAEERVAKRAQAGSEARLLAIDVLDLLLNPPKRVSEELTKLLEDELLPATLVLFVGNAGPCPEESGTADRRRRISFRPKATKKDPPRETLLSRLRSGQLTPEEALAYVEGLQDLDPRVRYDIACVYTQRGDLERASATLTQAMEEASAKQRQRLASWGLSDASLAPLLEAKGHRKLKKKMEAWAK